MKKIVYLLLLGLAGCQQEGVITEVPKDDWSVVANTAGQVKGQVNIKFKELPEDLQIVTTRSGVDTDNGQLNFVIRQLGGTRLERVFPHAGKFEARTRKAGLHLWYQVSFDENIPTAEAMKALSELPNVSIVEPIYKGKTESVSLPYNDPYLPRQWHLYNDGSNGMLAGADISILDAWEIEKGKPEVIVNVVTLTMKICGTIFGRIPENLTRILGETTTGTVIKVTGMESERILLPELWRMITVPMLPVYWQPRTITAWVFVALPAVTPLTTEYVLCAVRSITAILLPASNTEPTTEP